jgi:hypothetical protein
MLDRTEDCTPQQDRILRSVSPSVRLQFTPMLTEKSRNAKQLNRRGPVWVTTRNPCAG